MTSRFRRAGQSLSPAGATPPPSSSGRRGTAVSLLIQLPTWQGGSGMDPRRGSGSPPRIPQKLRAQHQNDLSLSLGL